MRPILTIAVPTYNRAEKLKKGLELVVMYSRGKDIEIIVYDNASTDNTMETVKEIQKNTKMPIKYYRNDTNLGFDGNFLNCFEKANGKYVWLLSDDDILLPGAVESVLSALEKNPVCIHLNTCSLKSEVPQEITFPRFKDEGLIVYEDKNDFVEKIGINCTFISSLVFSVDLVRKVSNKERFFNTSILQSHILFEIMKNDGLYIINTYNCVAARGNKKVSYDILRVWVKNYSDLLLDTGAECGFDMTRMKEVLRIGLSTTVYGFVLRFRQTCENEAQWDRDCIWQYVEKYPELMKKYKKAVNCPIGELKFVELKYKIVMKIKDFRELIKKEDKYG